MSGSAKKRSQDVIVLELNPASGVDVLGDPPLLWQGVERDFTPAEAEKALRLVNEHGTPILRIYSPQELEP